MKSILLLSAGLDSTVSAGVAARETEIVRAITLDYGQRAAAREVERSRRLALHFGVAHELIRLDFLARLTAPGSQSYGRPRATRAAGRRI